MFGHLDESDPGAGNEIQLTDALGAADRRAAARSTGLRFDGKRFDCGDKVGYLEANIAFALGPAGHVRAVRGFCAAIADYQG